MSAEQASSRSKKGICQSCEDWCIFVSGCLVTFGKIFMVGGHNQSCQYRVLHTYRVDQQCCLFENHPEATRRWFPGGIWIFCAKSLAIPALYTKFKLICNKFNLCMAGITSTVQGGLWMISARTTLLVHTVCRSDFPWFFHEKFIMMR